MKFEELAFVNQQLAGMLKIGIPLEQALRELCRQMRQGKLRAELQALEADLARGVPLEQALTARQFPGFYVKMVQLGARTNNLPGILILIADYYQRAHLGWTRLKGLMVYPAIVLVASIALSAFIAVLCSSLAMGAEMQDAFFMGTPADMDRVLAATWVPPVALAVLAIALLIMLSVPAVRSHARWWLPGFKEQSLTNFASTMNLMLSSGSHLGEALDLAGHLEARSPAGAELRTWKSRLAGGHAKIADMANDSKVFPPLFIWLLAQGGEDLAAGFKKAAEIYFARAVYRIDLLLYVALPVSVLVLGVTILGQFLPVFTMLVRVIDSLGGDFSVQ